MKTYVVKYKEHEKVYTDIGFAIAEAEKIGETGVNVYVYAELDGVREEEPFFSCVWEI